MEEAPILGNGWELPLPIHLQVHLFQIHLRKNLKQNRRLVAASLTGISPRPMLMGAPHDALRASNAGVSLKVPVVVANRVPLCFGIASVSLPPHGKIMAGAVLWLTPARTYLSALFLPQSQLFSMCNIGF